MMQAFLSELWMILTESSVWLIAGFLFAGIVHVLVPREWMLKHLGGKGIAPILKASLLGIPLPLCSCSVIPVAAGLRSQGASKGASAAFAISTPQTGEESIPITWALFGPVFAFARPVVAVVTALIAGFLIDLTEATSRGSQNENDPDPGAIGLTITNTSDAGAAVESVTKAVTKAETSCCSTTSAPTPAPTPESAPESACCSTQQPSTTKRGLIGNIKESIRYGFAVMLVDLVVWLTIGLLMAALIGAAVPQGWIEQNVGQGLVPMLLMLVVGIPLYICATSSTPFAFGLVAAGLSPGAALVLLLSGPATNVATMSWMLKDLGTKALLIYLAVIATVALSAGLLFDAFFQTLITLADTSSAHDHGAMGIGYKDVFAVLFVMLTAWALGIKARTKIPGSTSQATQSGCCSSNEPQSCSSGCGCASTSKKPAASSGCCGS
ncbi:MAG: SO_0444 family Cu/Zn efflux transporter [Phycisphaerales bacterium]